MPRQLPGLNKYHTKDDVSNLTHMNTHALCMHVDIEIMGIDNSHMKWTASRTREITIEVDHIIGPHYAGRHVACECTMKQMLTHMN